MIHMRRPRRAAFFRIFLPPLFGVLVICFAFAIPPKDATMRVWIDGNLLISCVMFHATMSEQTPDIQELTLADKFMVGVYSFIFVSFMVSIVLLKLQRDRMYQVAESFYRYAESVVWCTAPTYFILLYYQRMSLYHVLLILLAIAAGVIALMKLYLAIKCKCLPPSEHFKEMSTMTSQDLLNHDGQPHKAFNYQRLPDSDAYEHEDANRLKHRHFLKPCFPGIVKSTNEQPCLKQITLPNRKA